MVVVSWLASCDSKLRSVDIAKVHVQDLISLKQKQTSFSFQRSFKPMVSCDPIYGWITR
jgi:hypothetical protein